MRPVPIESTVASAAGIRASVRRHLLRPSGLLGWQLLRFGGIRTRGLLNESFEVPFGICGERLINRAQMFERLGREFPFLLVHLGKSTRGRGEITARQPHQAENVQDLPIVGIQTPRLRKSLLRLL